MTGKLYYWAENLDGYSSDNEQDYDQIIEIKRLNFFIGKNNAGKSRFLRNIFSSTTSPHRYQIKLFRKISFISQELEHNDKYNNLRSRESFRDFFPN